MNPDSLHDAKKFWCRRHHTSYHGSCGLHNQEAILAELKGLRDEMAEYGGAFQRLSLALFGRADSPPTQSHPVPPAPPEEQDRPSSGAGPVVGNG